MRIYKVGVGECFKNASSDLVLVTERGKESEIAHVNLS